MFLSDLTGDVISRFNLYIDSSDVNGCHIWTSDRHSKGYGRIYVAGKAVKAHRVAWCLHNQKDFPTELHCMHICDNPPCCRGDHLVAGTNKDNVADKVSKGRALGRPGETNHNSYLTTDKVRHIRQIHAAGILSVAQIARDFNVSEGNIRMIVKGRSWKFPEAGWLPS